MARLELKSGEAQQCLVHPVSNIKLLIMR